MISIVSLLVVLALSILVTRIATVALTHTGLAVAFDRFEIAVLLAVLNVCTLFFFGRVKETVASGDDD
jgi:hypothetical protein